MRKLLAVTLFLACAATAAAFDPTKTPVSPDGTRAIVDLPASQHMRNTGGMGRRGPGTGPGLCVFTSIEHAGRWQNIAAINGLQKWMTVREGGGYPQKVDAMLKQFCKEKGFPVPAYIQHTGGDADFLEQALRTDRVVCVTYAGQDDFYGGPIAHMVNLAHLDAKSAAIVDNNRPGYWVWMSRSEFLDRWRDMQGGWAIVFLDPPPPSYPADDAKACEHCGKAGCVCGDECRCKPGECPRKCPVVFGQCGGGSCRVGGSGPVGPLSYPLIPLAPTTPLAPQPLNTGLNDGVYNGEIPPGPAPEGMEWRKWGDAPGYGWRLKGPGVGGVENHGVSSDKIHSHPDYTICRDGVVVEGTKADAMHAMANGVADDSDRWHLTAVGDEGFLSKFKADVTALPDATRNKLLVQAYTPDRWEASQFKLATGVTLRKPSPARTSATVGTVAGGDYSAAKLAELLAAEGGPSYVKPAPKPPEPPKVDPVKPSVPDSPPTPVKPAPDNGGTDKPAAPDKPKPDANGLLLAAVLAALYLLSRLFPKNA